jgi:iron complex transport system ATP-binding protein
VVDVEKAAEGLRAQHLRVGYGAREVLHDVSVSFPNGALTAVVGPNGCGKSTLLRAISHLLPIRSGSVQLDGGDVGAMRQKERARRIGFLPQESVAPEGITVRRLVARGRFPHQGLLSAWSSDDARAVEGAMRDARLGELADVPVASLSGGQRQRVWIAMALAQETPHVLLDEPTTFLDVAHQYELLRLLRRLVRDGRTVIAILHDLNQAARFADHLVVMHAGVIVGEGSPDEVLQPSLLEAVFDLPSLVVPDPVTGRPMMVPTTVDGEDPVGAGPQ